MLATAVTSQSKVVNFIFITIALAAVILIGTIDLTPSPHKGGRRDIRIPVYQQQYIEVQVGKPGKVLKLRIRRDLNDSYLYSDPSQYSNTFSSDSELFFLSQDVAPMRLKVVWGLEPLELARRPTNGGVSADGVLGLGPASQIWLYWQKWTYSKFTLTFGKDDLVDTLDNGDATSAYGGHFIAASAATGLSFSMPMTIHMDEEYTYVPMAIFSNLSKALEAGKRVPLRVSSTVDSTPLTFWLSTETSIIINSYGKPENSIRRSERYGKDPNEIQIGRIQLLDDFVFFEDRVTRSVTVREVFDTYPSVGSSQSPQAWLAPISLVAWACWTLAMTPGLYFWLWYGMMPAFRTIRSRLHAMSEDMNWFKKKKPSERQAIGGEQAQPIPPPHGLEDLGLVAQRSYRGPLDWSIISPLIFMARAVCLVSFFVATWGYNSHRFSARLAKLGRVPPMFGDFIYWALAGYMLVAPFIVNGYFMRRFANLGSTMVTIALIISAWINRLPDTTSAFFSIGVSLLGASFALRDSLSYLVWIRLAGTDSSLFDSLVRSYEFGLPSGKLHSALRTFMAPSKKVAPTTRAVGIWSYPGEVFMIVLWVFWVVPLILLWAVLLNFVPAIEYSIPRTPIKVWLCVAYATVVACIANNKTIGNYYRILEEALTDLREELIAIVSKMIKQ